MASILEGDVAQIVADAFGSVDLFMDATLTRSAPGSGDEVDPGAAGGATTTYTCKAIEDTFSKYVIANNLVSGTDVNVLILANTLVVTPQPLDRITIRGVTYQIVGAGTPGLRAVSSDPARATWSCRCGG